MSGFSRLTSEHGITHFLSLIAQRRALVIPIVERFKGKFVKAEADDVFLLFPTPLEGLNASLAIFQALQKWNQGKPEKCHIHASHAIAYGWLLDLGDDYFGHPVNIASKLGEDIAQKDEILITEEVYEVCRHHPTFQFLDFVPKKAFISGIELEYYQLSL